MQRVIPEYESLQKQEVLDSHFIISVTDAEGHIIYANENFCKISGYSHQELIGGNHRLLKSGLHSLDYYRDMWRTISSGKSWSGELCNRKKNGEHYWVKATISPILDSLGVIHKYISYRTDITDVKKQEQLQSTVLSSLAECIIGLDHNGNCTFTNDAALKTLGFQEGEMHGKYLHKVIHHHKEDGSIFNEAECFVFNTLKDEKVRSGEQWFFRKNGEGFPAEVTVTPHYENKQFVGVVLSFHDIADRKIAEKKLKESEERLKVALDGVESGVWDWNIETGTLYWSDHIAVLFGYEVGQLEVSYENFITHLHPEDRKAVTEAIQNAVEYDIPYDIEHRIIRADGSVHWLLERGVVVRDANGNAIQMMGTVISIHNRKLAELKLKESEDRINIAIEGAGVGVWDWQIEIDNVIVSELFASMLGYTEQELYPFNVRRWAGMLHADDRDEALQRVEKHLADRSDFYESSFRMKCKDGTWKWILSRGKVVEYNNSGEPSRMTGIHTDISRQKELEQELEQARDYAENANKAKSVFLSTMSHELRTPLNAILGFSQLLTLDDELPLAKSQKESIEHIIKGGKHLLSLINQVLELSAIEAGKVDLNIEAVQVNDVVSEVLDLMSPVAALDNIELVVLSNDRSSVKADAIKLKQVLLNLLSNGIKYNKKSGLVKISWMLTNGWVRINVEDSGVGIAPNEQQKVFSAFNRLGQKDSSIEGTGIGLVVTKGLVELMGGQIGFESKLAIGTNFYIDLPQYMSDTTESKNTEIIGKSLIGDVTPGGKSMRHVLYVEDNYENSRLMEKYFHLFSSITLHIVETAEEALKLLSQKSFDLILMDINLPGISGLSLTQKIKSEKDSGHLPVIAVTANSMPQDIELALNIFDAYLTKPIDFDVLAEELRRYL